MKRRVLQHIDLDDPQLSRRIRGKRPRSSARGHRRDLQRRLHVLRSYEGCIRGRDEINRIASEIRATHPDFQYQPIAAPEELGNCGRVKWVSGRLGEARLRRDSFIIARDGLIAPFIFFSTSPLS